MPYPACPNCEAVHAEGRATTVDNTPAMIFRCLNCGRRFVELRGDVRLVPIRVNPPWPRRLWQAVKRLFGAADPSC